jgi:GAF domain-containing protein
MNAAARKAEDPQTTPDFMVQGVKAALEGETDVVAALANCSAVIKSCLDDVNWAGFYILKGAELVLGPFQGLPACSRIGEGRGVCGKAVLDAAPVIVPDVHAFPGHIACDSASRSEIVIPLFRRGRVYGVLDVDSPRPDRFSAREAECLGRAAALIGAFLDG